MPDVNKKREPQKHEIAFEVPALDCRQNNLYLKVLYVVIINMRYFISTLLSAIIE